MKLFKTKNLYFSLFLIIVVSLHGANESDTDWPCWRNITMDGKSPLTGINKDWSKGLEVIWQVDDLCLGEIDSTDPALERGRASTATWSSPVVKDNMLVVPGRFGEKDIVFCYDANTGKKIWQSEYTSSGSSAYGSGSRATPYIDNNRVYTYGQNGELTCWDLKTGKMNWQKDVDDEGGIPTNFGYCSSPLVYKNMVVVFGGGDAMVISYDKLSGEVLWKYVPEDIDRDHGKPGYCSPIIANFGTGDVILALHAGILGDLRNGHEPGKLVGLKPASGEVMWQSPWWSDWDLFSNTPVIDGSTIVLESGRRGGSKAITVKDNTVTDLWENWRNKILTPMHSDPIIIDGYIYGYSEDARSPGELQCVELITGKLIWKTKEAENGTMVYVDGHLICLTYTGKLLLIKLSPEGFNKVAEFVINLKMDHIPKKSRYAWTTPTIANGNLYIRFCNQLICYKLEKE